MELSQPTKHLYYLLTQGTWIFVQCYFQATAPEFSPRSGLLETTSLPVRKCVAPGRVAELNKCRDLASLLKKGRMKAYPESELLLSCTT